MSRAAAWSRRNGDAENAGLENAGLENAGTSCVWVAKCNIINVRGHVRVNVTAGRGAFLGHLQRTTVDCQADVSRLSRGMTIRRAKKRKIHESRPVCVCSTTTSTPDSNF